MTGELVLPDHRNFKWLTVVTVVSLAIGLLLGLVAHGNLTPQFKTLYLILKPIEQMWMLGIRLVVIPLIFLYIVVAVAGRSRDSGTSAAIKSAAILHLTLLSVTLAFTLAIVSLVLPLYEITPEIAETFKASGDVAEIVYPFDIPSGVRSVWNTLFVQPWLDAIFSQILMIVGVAFVLAFITLRLPERAHLPIMRISTAGANLCMKGVAGLLYFMPLGVFALAYTVALAKGASLLTAVLFFIALVSSLLIAATLLLYPAVAIFGRVSMSRFARAVAPAQSVAFGTRSSLMCLASLTAGAHAVLRIPREVTSVILPVSVSTFKLNRMVSTPAKLFFLAHLYSIDLAFASAFVLIALAFIKSFGTAGIPSGGSMTTLPLYLAAGIPLEGILILKAVDVIPDIFKTILNATEDLAVTTIAAHRAGMLADRAIPVPANVE